MTTRFVHLSTLLLALAGTAQAQLISIRTVPVAQSDQFDIYPSHNLAMGGVYIALADPLLDPFINPAKAVRETRGRFYGSPLLYRVSLDAGAGRSLPLAGVARVGPWFGTASLAIQQVDASGASNVFRPQPLPIDIFTGQPIVVEPSGRSHTNRYAYAAFGRTLSPTGLSVAGSLRWAGLHAIDGVDLLYAGSSEIRQMGYAGDVRLGLLKEWPGEKSFEMLFLHNRFRMTHDVTFLDAVWDPALQRPGQRARLQRNFDHSTAWGLHAAYERPVSSEWRVGGIVTTNIMSHPKLPEYDVRSVGIVPIWGDPGYSFAFNLGVGVSKTRNASTFGMDLVYEPIFTNTWGEATSPMPTRDGKVVAAGSETVENWFTFSNIQFRIGVDQKALFSARSPVGLQLGLMMHSINYFMRQHDNIQALWRDQTESWVEWAPTWGLTLRFTDMDIRYRGRVTNGTGRPGVFADRCGRGCEFATVADATPGSNILVAPTGPLTLTPVSVWNHQVSLSIPIR